MDIKESKWMAVMKRKVFFMVGLGLGLIAFALTAMSGLEVERSSLLQLYNFFRFSIFSCRFLCIKFL